MTLKARYDGYAEWYDSWNEGPGYRIRPGAATWVSDSCGWCGGCRLAGLVWLPADARASD
jgi:hypothetical protein